MPFDSTRKDLGLFGGVKLHCSSFTQTKVGDRRREFPAQEYAEILDDA